jgi:hypothetical protein
LHREIEVLAVKEEELAFCKTLANANKMTNKCEAINRLLMVEKI